MTSKARRDLEREHQARILKTKVGHEPRPSRTDEADLTRAVRNRERDEREAALQLMLGHLARAESELRAAREQLPAVDRATRRDLDRIRQAITRIRDRCDARPPGRDEPAERRTPVSGQGKACVRSLTTETVRNGTALGRYDG